MMLHGVGKASMIIKDDALSKALPLRRPTNLPLCFDRIWGLGDLFLYRQGWNTRLYEYQASASQTHQREEATEHI